MRLGRLVKLAWKSLWLHRLRSLLTVVGILFGVGAVIAMLAIGEGASQQAQEQIRKLGSSNLLLASVQPSGEGDSGENESVLRYGLLDRDYDLIRATVPEVVAVVPRRDVRARARHADRSYRTVVMGTTPDYADIANLRLARGRFLSPADAKNNMPVCVLGQEVSQKLFLNRDPVGRDVHVGKHGYRVVGVLSARGEGTGGTAGVGGESDAAIFIPRSTMDERYGSIVQERASGSRTRTEVELHRITVKAERGDEPTVGRVAGALRHLIKRNHPKEDVRLTVPLELLRQARETQRRWTLMLATIASISLLVGGIGIMNIMLASIIERTREIGIRRALGAKRAHIVAQFLAETVLLSVSGGLIGVGGGVGFSMLLQEFAKMPIVVEPWFIGLAFGISAAIGIIFGVYPAVRAAGLDPVEALRHE